MCKHYNLDQETVEYFYKFRTPDGGGIHGIEWYEGFIWRTAFNPKAIYNAARAYNTYLFFKIPGTFIIINGHKKKL